MHGSVICIVGLYAICSKSAFREYLTDPDKILQANVSRTQISGFKILAPRAKGAQKWRRKSGCFYNWYNQVVFRCNGIDRHEIRAKTSIGVLALLNLNRGILKIFS